MAFRPKHRQSRLQAGSSSPVGTLFGARECLPLRNGQEVFAASSDVLIEINAGTNMVMLAHHISGLPVMDSNGKLVGILFESDFVRRSEIGAEHARNRLLTIAWGRSDRA
jgi:CBS domain-containing protein